jgi:NADPH:quinone reductase-like Zn-dependent oxidoreductase
LKSPDQSKLGGILVKAIVYEKFGPPDLVLQLKEVEKPTPRDNEVLVEIHAASINFGDWGYVRGEPFVVRLIGAGLLKPKYKILGSDIAGRVEAVGRNVEQFQPGDEVYGELAMCGWGGFAEYASAPENVLALKPANLTFEEAAAVPQAATVALHGLRDNRQVQPGQKVLINGASGGIGTFAVQIAKSFGAEVTGVCSTRNLDMVRSIGADYVIDYTKEDFTQNEGRYDRIIDIVANRSMSDYMRALSPKGNYVAVAFNPSTMFARGGGKKAGQLAVKSSVEDLVFLKELIEAGKVSPVIDRSYPLSEVAEALRYYGERHSQGKVVITVEH